MSAVLVAIGVVEIVVAVVLHRQWRNLAAARGSDGGPSPTTASRATGPRRRVRLAGEPLRLTLDLEAPDPTAPTVARLAQEAATRALGDDASVDEVIVTDRRGVVLGRHVRPEPLPEEAPQAEGHIFVPRPRGHTPRVVRSSVHAPPLPIPQDLDPMDLHVEGRPLAQWFDLPDSVRQRLRSPDDAVELVRAILDAAGLAPQVEGDVITCGDRVVIVTGPDVAPGSRDALSHAYLRFAESQATSGLAVSFTYLDPTDVRRRELLAPALRHVSSAGVQRMADAAALGADPLDFAKGPVIVNR